MMTRPRFSIVKPDSINACVPMNRLWTLNFGLWTIFRLPVCNSTLIPSGSNHFWKFLKCCSAKISVGAISVTLKPLSKAMSAEQAATAVFPEPTSPCNKRLIGCAPPMSALISRSTFVCAAVNLKPSRARKGFISRLSPPHDNAFVRASKFFRRDWICTCSFTNSSSASLRRAISTSVISSGK